MKSYKTAAVSVLAALTLALCALLAACAEEELPQAAYDALHATPAATPTTTDAGTTDAGTTDAGTQRPEAGPVQSAQCQQALAESLPARIAVVSAGAAPTAQVETVDDLYQLFWPGHCQMCHPSRNSFQITSGADLASPGSEGFASKGEEALHHLMSDGIGAGIDEAMPPIDATMGCDGLGATKRTQMCATSALVIAVQKLSAWVAAGKPNSYTVAPAATSGDGGAPPSPYLMTAAVGNGMTNLGNCIPDTSIVAMNEADMTAIDVKFANMQRVPAGAGTPAQVIGLPEKIGDTDLTTFDGEALARMGVIGYSPQYPLWSDDAGKIRHVRVPRGESIRFDAAKQDFVIPPNTRFYKTFLKHIIDTDGNPSWRKIETRLIVSRPDTQDANGNAVQNALYGTYLWNQDETDASLVGIGNSHGIAPIGDEPLKDGTGFKDTMLEYETNVLTHDTRHYAVPSSTRCVECHMGSPSQSFVLGFRPVQLIHRPVGLGGVIESSGFDEMGLFRRLIEYGIITGIQSAADVLPLEQSQGARLPRNNHELIAQGYMLGNCSHCHNPRGYPSVTFPVLKNVLSFLPGATGGIFQFPLEAYSPRITRGYLGNVQIPYITPSLVDNPSFPPTVDPNNGDESKQVFNGSIWRPKWDGSANIGSDAQMVYAPWRSLIYRNVDTPFTETDDFAIYPHMPMNTPGYDDRAKQILGDWMVSIPAIRKRPDTDEYGAPYELNRASNLCGGDPVMCVTLPCLTDTSSQPYVEVKPTDPGFVAATTDVGVRLATFHAGTRDGENLVLPHAFLDRYVPNTLLSQSIADDIVDHSVDPTCQPSPGEDELPLLNIPTHVNWVNLDLTVSTTTAWTPRRTDWPSVFSTLPDGGVPPEGGVPPDPNPMCNNGQTYQGVSEQEQQCTVDMLNGVDARGCGAITYDGTVAAPTVDSAFSTFAKKPRPMGLWKEKPSCDWSRDPWLTAGPTVTAARAKAAATNTDHPWLDRSSLDPNAHVYSQSPGEAVFGMICINCHGPQADAKGRLADNIATMTGGNAIVADFRDGLFGPRTNPGANRMLQFGDAGVPGVSVDDWTAHYMAWMALGGTRVIIPPAFLTLVGQTPVIGEVRHSGIFENTANMLTIAHDLCAKMASDVPFDCAGGSETYLSGLILTNKSSPLLFDNGDAELWLNLCSYNNPPPVAVLGVPATGTQECVQAHPITLSATGDVNYTFFRPEFFLTGCDPHQPPCIGDENGKLYWKLTPENHHPWCMTPDLLSGQTPYLPIPSGRPICPPPSTDPTVPGPVPDDGSALAKWSKRGAINAGMAVFTYLDAITKGTYPVKPTYDQCDALQP